MGEFTWAAAISLAALMFTGLCALLGVWWRIELRIQGAEKAAREKSSQLEREVSDLRIHLAEKYTSWETVKEIETRLADRIEKIAESVSGMPDVLVERIVKLMALSK